MLRLIKLEWSKFRKNTTIILLMTFFLLFFPCCLYFGKFLKNIENLPIKVDIFQAPHIWEYLGYAGNWMVFFFLGVLIIYTVSIEVTNKTMRQSIINGLSRQEFLLSKVLNILIVSTFVTLIYSVLCFGFGWYNTAEPTISKILDNEWAIPRFFLMATSYMTFAMFIAFQMRKAGIAVFFYLTYVIIIEPLLRRMTQDTIFNNKIVNFFPMNATEDLMPLSLMKMAEDFSQSQDFDIFLSYTESAIAAIIYIGIFLSITYYSFLRRDI